MSERLLRGREAMTTKNAARHGGPAVRERAQAIDEYVAHVPQVARAHLKRMREVVRSAVPAGAHEVMSYTIPAFKLGKVLVWYAAFAKHLSLFPGGSVLQSFKHELSEFRTSKGTVQFPLDQPLPVHLIKRIVRARVAQVVRKPGGSLNADGRRTKKRERSVVDLFKQIPATIRPTVKAARRLVKAVAPQAVELLYQSRPPRSPSALWKLARYVIDGSNVMGIGTFSTNSLLYFYRGRELDGRPGLLEGGGKAMRFIRLSSRADAGRSDVRRTVRRAFQLAAQDRKATTRPTRQRRVR